MKQLKNSPAIRYLILLRTSFIAIVLIGCSQPIPKSLETGTFGWVTYSNTQLAYSLKYPDIYTKSEERDGKDIVFQYDGITAMRVLFVSEEEGTNRGLWVKSKPVEEIEMAGVKGYRYVYNHYDLLASVHTISCVIEYKGKLLGLEFRTDENILDDVQKTILNSLEFN